MERCQRYRDNSGHFFIERGRNKRSLNEACQLWLEQEIDSGLERGDTPYAIVQLIAKEVEKLFEVKMKPGTIKERARRKQLKTMDTNVPTSNPSKQQKKTGGQKGGDGVEAIAAEYVNSLDEELGAPTCPVCKVRLCEKQSRGNKYLPKCHQCRRIGTDSAIDRFETLYKGLKTVIYELRRNRWPDTSAEYLLGKMYELQNIIAAGKL